MISDSELTELIASEFPLTEDIVYLNHAGISPWPRRSADAVKRFADENLAKGATNYAEWLLVEAHLRQQLADLIHAESSDDIALLKNTSEGLSFVAAGLDWRAGDNIVSTDQEFPSNRIVWEALRARDVELRQACLSRPDVSPEQALTAACDEHTRLMSVSAVQYATGLKLHIPDLGAFCRDRNILFCVDAIQQIGALPFNVQEAQADFVVADGHKWMLGPEGVALFWVRPTIREQLRLCEFGWHMTSRPGDYDSLSWEPARSARRFECGSPNLLGIHALAASVGLLMEIGMDTVNGLLIKNVSHLIERINELDDFLVASSTASDRLSGIVSVRSRRVSIEQVHQFLSARGVICAVRAGCLRFSPHFYSPRERLDRACSLLSQSAARA